MHNAQLARKLPVALLVAAILGTVASACFGDASSAPAGGLSMTGPASIRSISAPPLKLARYGRFQIAVDLSATYANPFDPAQIDLSATFLGPGGETRRVDGFLDQDFSRSLSSAGDEDLAPAGKPHWLIRFAPDRVGLWRYKVALVNSGKTVVSSERSFRVTPSGSEGFVHVSRRSPSMFSFDGEKTYFPIGEDMCWPGKRGTFDYDQWLPKLHSAGGNWIRLWMAASDTRLEWSVGHGGDGLGRYDLANAWRLGKILDIAARNHVYVLVTLGTYGQFTTGGYFNEGEWASNPYNAANGGPCATPAQFWTDPTARRLYRQELRYIVSRYGWRTHIMGWEFWNETTAPEPWIHEMAEYLRGVGPFAGRPADPYGHPISTTWGSPQIWSLPEIDFTQSHLYGEGQIPDMSPATVSDARAAAVYGKPHLESENGISWKGPDSQYDPAGKGVNLHDCIWAATAAGDAGSSMIWWWDDYVDPDNLYRMFTPLAKFSAGIPWTAGAWRPLTSTTIRTHDTGGAPRDVAIQPTMGWGAGLSSPVSISPDSPTAVPALPSFLYGPDKASMHKPVDLIVDFAKPGSLVLHVASVSSQVVLNASIDGKLVWTHDFEADPSAAGAHPEYKSTAVNAPWKSYIADFDRDYSIPMPAGRHVVSVSAAKGDWLNLSEYLLQGYVPPTVADALLVASANKDCAIVWVHDREYDWYSVLHGTPIAPIGAAETQLLGLPPGLWRIDWYDTAKGRFVRSATERNARAGLRLAIPPISTDIAARIVRLSPH